MQPVTKAEKATLKPEKGAIVGKAKVQGREVIYDHRNNRMWIRGPNGFVAHPIPGSVVDAIAEANKNSPPKG